MGAMSHYEVLGVSPLASADAIRRAYRQRARQVHPDRQAVASRSSADTEQAGRAMQELNEAWRVLSDPGRRASYDQLLLQRPHVHRRPPLTPEDDTYDQPYPHRLSEPGDVGIAIVRSLPWVAIVAVLGAIFVFTAFAGESGDDPVSGSDLVGRCVVLQRGGEVATVPCDGPSDGRVDLIAARSSLCPPGSDVARLAGQESWLCLRDPGTAGASTSEAIPVPR